MNAIRFRGFGALALTLGLGCLSSACGVAPVEEDAQLEQQAIENGQLESGVPSVVFLTDYPAAEGVCTATMLSPTVALTARHCNDDHRPMVLDAGRDPHSGFVDHLVDTALVHPAVDLMLVHVGAANPVFTGPGTYVGDIAVDSYMKISSSLPAVGDNVIAVGYGAHTATDVDPYDARYKRSAAERVVSVDRRHTAFDLVEASAPYAAVPPGITRGGDSGGPVVFNNRLVAINDLGHSTPVTALDVDVDWVNDNINLALPTETDSLYVMRNGLLLRTNPSFGNYVTAVNADFSTTATSMAAFPVSSSDIYIVAYTDLWRVTKSGGLSELVSSHLAWDGPTKLTAMGTSLYIMQGGCLRRINPANGAYSAPIGSCTWGDVSALTNLNGLLYATKGGNLYSVSTVNGSATKIASVAEPVTNLTTIGSYLYVQDGNNITKVTTGGAKTIVSQGWASSPAMGAFGGSLYVVQADYLSRVNVADGTWKQLGYHDWHQNDGNTIMMVSIPGGQR
jgi:hypothetical protein